MSDWRSRPAGAGENPAERAAREARHQVLIELLGAYADGELPPETTSQIDAHLVGCARCRRELAIHRAMRHRLGDEPPVAAPPALRERIRVAIAAESERMTRAEEAALAAETGQRAWAVPRRAAWIGAAAVLVTALAGAGLARRAASDAPPTSRLATATVPLVRAVVADYRRVTAGDLPGRSRDLDMVRSAVPFPIEPLRAPGVRLLAAWTTTIDGDPAAVLAYRWDDRIVLEYLVPEERFFQHSAIRDAVRDGRVLTASDGAQGIAAWPTEAAGAIVVGDRAAERLATLAPAGGLAGSAARGAQ